MAPHLFLEGASALPVVPNRALQLVHQEPQATLPESLVLDAGGTDDGLDVVTCCARHQWASLRVVLEPGMVRPRCPYCVTEREQWDGHARYADLLAKRRAGVL